MLTGKTELIATKEIECALLYMPNQMERILPPQPSVPSQAPTSAKATKEQAARVSSRGQRLEKQSEERKITYKVI